jgi:hypothetical protein
MEYMDKAREGLLPHVDQLRRDLEHVRHLRSQSLARTEELERQAVMLEGLLTLCSPIDKQAVEEGGRGLTLHDAMSKVLTAQPERMMRPADLAAEIRRLGLYVMRDGRSVETQQIHARVGHYPQLFTREGTFIKLVDQVS